MLKSLSFDWKLLFACYKAEKGTAMTQQTNFTMDKDVQRLIRAKKIQVKLGMLYCTTDEQGNIVWRIEQIPVFKK